jgi:predicted unusual protein kinase regulating ubiquinone biosynthesis (AarF/ABC1/UbiB family)/nucleotide-binding universal stress UspA family protein
VVATDGSPTASVAVDWATRVANAVEAELVLVQIIVADDGAADGARAVTSEAASRLEELARQKAGSRGRARVTVHQDPALGIVAVAHEEGADAIVVGNLGMSGRTKFLLGNVPNRVSHNARCTVVIVNTSPDGGTQVAFEAPPEPTDIREELPPGHLIGRATTIGRVMARHGTREILEPKGGDRGETDRSRARALRGAMEELGPTFSKLGQILSTRPDLLPPQFIDELSTLQDHVPPMTEEEVVRVMEQELGVPWEDVFASIDPEPLAAGTLAEVHRATLESGERVVVKVQRPTARGDITQDLGLLQLFADKTKSRPAFSQVFDMPGILDNLSDALERELDFRLEGQNLERMREVLEPYPRLDVPGIYQEYSTDRLLVMEEIQGIPLREAPEGQARQEAARQLLESFYGQILTDGFFHADPHPGNLMWADDKIYFLDLGMVGELGADLRELLLLLLMAFWQEDTSFLADVVLMIAGTDGRADLDIEAFEHEIAALMARYRHLSLKEIQLGPLLQDLTEIAIRHDVRLPASLALTGKAIAQMQLAAAQLDPSLDPFDVAGSFVMKRVTSQIRQRMNPQKMFYEVQKLRTRAVRLVESIERLTGARPGPKLQISFTGTADMERIVKRAGRRIALAIGGGAALVAAGSIFAARGFPGIRPSSRR